MTRFLALFALLTLAACGFQPVYGQQGGTGQGALAAVSVAPIPKRAGQQLRNALTDRLQARGAQTAKYRLTVGLSEGKTDFGIRKDATATRGQLAVYADWRLTEIASGREIVAARARAINYYDILVSEYGTMVTEEDARGRGLNDLADSISERVALALAPLALAKTP